MKRFVSILKVVIPVMLAMYLVYYMYNKLNESQKTELTTAITHANYWIILIGMTLGWFSHLSRAYRWSYMLNPLGYKPKFWNNYHAVMIGYVMNLAFPRLGEASRCTVLGKYENVPFNKSFGTVLAERVADFIILITLSVLTIFFQYNLLREKALELTEGLSKNFTTEKFVYLIIFGAVIIVGFVILFKVLKNHGFVEKIRLFVKGLGEGLTSILTMKTKWKFIGHTLFIWIMYLCMFSICFWAVDSTAHVGFGGIMASFVFGSFAIILVQGGIGVYPVVIMETLLLYGISEGNGFALGWIIWSSQTLMVTVLGGLSFILLPIYNKKKRTDGTHN